MRYIEAKCRLCRREGMQLFLKGDRCKTQKCSVLKKNYPPGQHGKLFGKKSEFGRQLREKQKTKRLFNVSERVMKKYYRRAHEVKGNTADDLLKHLMLRLDNIIYLAGLCRSRDMARQLIIHGYFKVNNKTAKSPSLRIKKGDKITVISGKRQKHEHLFSELVKQKIHVPRFLKVDFNTLSCELMDVPQGKELEANINPQLILAFYSR